MKTEHILIIRFSAIGDVAMTVPVVYSLAHQYPNVRITFLSKPFARPFFDNLAPNVGFMEADIKNEYHGVKGLNALYRRLTAKNFTAIADLHNVLRSNYLRMRFNLDMYKVAHINKHRSGKRSLVQLNGKVLKQQPTTFHNYCEVFEKLGYPVKMNFTSIFNESRGDLNLLPKMFREINPSVNNIGIAPFAAHKGKIYPIEKMEEVIDILCKNNPSCNIFLFGSGDKETKVFAEWTHKYSQVTNASGQMATIVQELILMSHLDLMISMDSANMHLASLVNIPVVSIWGATHPFTGFLGWNQSLDNAIQLDMPCRPCSIYGKKKCMRNDYACMYDIPPQLIVSKVENILKNKNK